jgi:hypothetical protein
LEDSIGTEFPTIPLPPRRHQPITSNQSDEIEANGSGENGGSGVANGEVKHEEQEGASNTGETGNQQQLANGTHS